MPTLTECHAILSVRPIETAAELREALERLRRLEIAGQESPRGRERAELELAICRYLASREQRVR